MEILLQVLLFLLSLICLLGGLNLLLKGARLFLPVNSSTPPVIDNLFRFLSGIYFGLGILIFYVVLNFHVITDLIYFIGLVVICSGLGRLYSKMKLGSAGKYFDNIMVIEIVSGLIIIILQYFR